MTSDRAGVAMPGSVAQLAHSVMVTFRTFVLLVEEGTQIAR